MKGLRKLNKFEEKEVKKAAKEYAKEYKKEHGDDMPSGIIGFIVKNGVYGITYEELKALIENAEKLTDGTILGEGDKFKAWCEARGRVVPDNALVTYMNADPYDAANEILRLIPTDSRLWKSWCTYRAGRGRIRV